MENFSPKDEARKILDTRKPIQFPVHVVDIAHGLGLNVLADSSYRLGGHGHTENADAGRFVIVVNNKQCPERKRFTIAHEIAHFIMDKDYITQHQIIDRDGNAADPSYRRRERRANEFAAELLMPEDEFVNQWLAFGGDVLRVADYFGVSKSASEWRAYNLGVTEAD